MPSRRTLQSSSSIRSSRTTVFTTSSSRVTTVVSSNRSVHSPSPKKVAVTPVRSLKSPDSPLTPGWVSGKLAIFSSPKSASPSPKGPRTRRSSVYTKKTVVASSRIPQKSSKTVKRSINVFKIPQTTTVFSPPGVKTRSRRSSMYVKTGNKSPLQSAALSVREMVEIVRSTSLENDEADLSPKRKILKAQRGSSSKKTSSSASRSISSSRSSSSSRKNDSVSSSHSSRAKSSKKSVRSPSKSPLKANRSPSKSPVSRGKSRPAKKISKSPSKSTKAGQSSSKKRARGVQASEDDVISVSPPSQKRRRTEPSSLSRISQKSLSPKKKTSRAVHMSSPKSSSKKKSSTSSLRAESLISRLEIDNTVSFKVSTPQARSASKKNLSPKKVSPTVSPKKTPKSRPMKKSSKSSSTKKSSKGERILAQLEMDNAQSFKVLTPRSRNRTKKDTSPKKGLPMTSPKKTPKQSPIKKSSSSTKKSSKSSKGERILAKERSPKKGSPMTSPQKTPKSISMKKRSNSSSKKKSSSSRDERILAQLQMDNAQSCKVLTPRSKTVNQQSTSPNKGSSSKNTPRRSSTKKISKSSSKHSGITSSKAALILSRLQMDNSMSFEVLTPQSKSATRKNLSSKKLTPTPKKTPKSSSARKTIKQSSAVKKLSSKRLLMNLKDVKSPVKSDVSITSSATSDEDDTPVKSKKAKMSKVSSKQSPSRKSRSNSRSPKKTPKSTSKSRKSRSKSKSPPKSAKRTSKSSSKRRSFSKTESSVSRSPSPVKAKTTPRSSTKKRSISKTSSRFSSRVSSPAQAASKTLAKSVSDLRKSGQARRSMEISTETVTISRVSSGSRLSGKSVVKTPKTPQSSKTPKTPQSKKKSTSPKKKTLQSSSSSNLKRKSLARSSLGSAKRFSVGSRRSSSSLVKSVEKRSVDAVLAPSKKVASRSLTLQTTSNVSPRDLYTRGSKSSFEVSSLKRTSLSNDSPLYRTPTSYASIKPSGSSVKTSVQTSTYRSTGGLSSIGMQSGQKRKTALTPFYDSLVSKRRRFNDSTDAVISPLVSSTPVGRRSIRSSLGSPYSSTRKNILSTSKSSTSSRGGYGDENSFGKRSYSNKRYSYNRNVPEDDDDDEDEDDEMYGEEYSTTVVSDDEGDVTITKSRTWCSVM